MGTPTTVRDLISYRREAEQYLGQDDHLYRVEWVSDVWGGQSWLLTRVVCPGSAAFIELFPPHLSLITCTIYELNTVWLFLGA